ncbi:MAG: hypothetical protein AABY22_17715 [Nanoarchaeota archaeon]
MFNTPYSTTTEILYEQSLFPYYQDGKITQESLIFIFISTF